MHESTLQDTTADADLSQREALLTINARRTLVLLRSVAEKTCDVLLYEPPTFWVNDTGELQTDYGALNVRIASVFRIEEDENSEPIYRVVLEEIDDLPVDEVPEMPKPKRRTLVSRLHYFPWRRMTAAVVVLIAIFLLGYSAYYGVRSLWQYYLNKAVAEARLAETNDVAKPDPVATREPREQPTSAPTNSSTTAQAALPVPAAATTFVSPAAAPAIAAPTYEQLHRPGASAFVVPEVVAALRMTQTQATALKNVNAETEQAIRELDRLWPSDNAETHARRQSMILDAARQQSLRMLTAEQRRHFAALSRS